MASTVRGLPGVRVHPLADWDKRSGRVHAIIQGLHMVGWIVIVMEQMNKLLTALLLTVPVKLPYNCYRPAQTYLLS